MKNNLQKTEKRFSPQVIKEIRRSIKEAGGGEVFFSCKVGGSLMVDEVAVAVRGGRSCLPLAETFIEAGDVIIHNHPSGDLLPEGADFFIISEIESRGMGFYIIDNDAEHLYPAAEIVKKPEKHFIDVEKAAGYLKEGGILSELKEDYEPRPQQIGFLKAVCRSFNSNNVCIAEAGTGIGKSFAYLIPAFLWAEANNERVVISTGTINLQHQLTERDIPAIKKLLGSTLKTALVKGRSNYLCLRKFYERNSEADLFGCKEESDAILAWIGTTKTGDKSDLGFSPEKGLWNDICSDSESCLGLYCKYRERCFVLKNRKELSSAKIIVVNHHLIFSDLYAKKRGASLGGTSVLPFYGRVIFDEAHNMEDSATSFFSEAINKNILAKTLNRIYIKIKTKEFGLFKFWKMYSKNSALIEKIPKLTEEIFSAADSMDKIIKINMPSYGVLDITADRSVDKYGIYDSVSLLKVSILNLFNAVSDLYDELSVSAEDQAEESRSLYETALIKNKLMEYIEICRSFTEPDDKNVTWIERKKVSTLKIAPLSVSEILKETLFKKLENIILVSATLSIKGNFSFFTKRIGADDIGREVSYDIFTSPFDYKKNVLFSVPTDIPEPGNDDYTAQLAELIKKTLLLSEGRGLVLFTSYSMLNAVYALVRDDFASAGIVLLKQGDHDNKKLLESFNRDCSSVLFATDSFWTGIDSPGETLSVLIICRLPFKVPSDPVIRARTELIEKNGGNSFMEYSLPEAVIKLRQGFGRLVRRKSDRGVVMVTDSRIITKFYGKIFLASLPETKKNFSGTDLLLSKIEEFLFP